MANRKISALASILNAELASGDLMHVVDISEVNDADKNKSITISELDLRYLNSLSDIDLSTLTEKTTCAAADLVMLGDSAASFTNKKLTFNNLNANLDHDALTNFVANEHIDWTSTTSNFSTSGTVGGGAATFTTVDTGQGANELYAMNQNVQTSDDVTFNNLSLTDYINFTTATGTGLAAERWIGADGGNSTFYNVPTTESHFFGINNTTAFTIDATAITVASGVNFTVDTSTLHVDSSNNRVGVGTASPATIFHAEVNGDTLALLRSSSAAGNAGFTLENSGDAADSWRMYRHNGGTFRIARSATQPFSTETADITIDTSGKIGIGTTSPDSKMHIIDSHTQLANEEIVLIENNTTGQIASLAFEAVADNAGTGNTAAIYFDPGATGSASDNQLQFNADHQSSLTPDMVITGDGDVGIGTTSPSNKLHIEDSGGSGDDVFIKNNNANFERLNIATKLTADVNDSLVRLTSTREADGSSAFTVQTGTGGSPSERMRIDSSGNVFLGTTTGTGILNTGTTSGDIVFRNTIAEGGAAGVDDLVVTQNFLTGSAANYTWCNTGYPFAVARNAGTLFTTEAGALADSFMVVNSIGNVGLGSTSPQAELHVETASAGADPSWNTTFDKMILEGSDNTNLVIFTPSTKVGQLTFADPSSRFQGAVRYDHTTDDMIFYTNVTEQMRILDTGEVGIGDSSPTAGIVLTIDGGSGNNTNLSFTENSTDKWYLRNLTGTDDFSFYDAVSAAERMRITSDGKLTTGGESAPDCVAGGITFFSGGNEVLLSSKASTWAHGMTSIAETDTAWSIGSPLIAAGGMLTRAYTETSGSWSVEAHETTEVTTDTSASAANAMINAYLKSGTTRGSHGSTGNLFGVSNAGTTRFLVKGNGDLHATNTSITALDNENDLMLARDLQFATAKDYKHRVTKEGMDKLKELGVIGESEEFMNLQAVHAVTMGAISQLGNVLGFLADKLGIDKQELLKEAQNYKNTLTY